MQYQKLSDFLSSALDNKKIMTSHISLYVALFVLWRETDFVDHIAITRRQVMKMAKIKGVATYHKCIRDLHEFGYIQYLPSRNPGIKSQVRLTFKKGTISIKRD